MIKPADRTILVSACLLGLKARYDGEIRSNEAVLDFIARGDWLPIPVCPEQLGGLPTPRPAAEFKADDGAALLSGNGRLVSCTGADVSSAFLLGAEQTAAIARICRCATALLKENSPSCGVHMIYRNGERQSGVGVTTAQLLQNGLTVFSEDDLSNGLLQEQEGNQHEQ